jgi:hypothetical protein
VFGSLLVNFGNGLALRRRWGAETRFASKATG